MKEDYGIYKKCSLYENFKDAGVSKFNYLIKEGDQLKKFRMQ